MDIQPSLKKFKKLKSVTKKWSSGITTLSIIGDIEHPERNYIILSRQLFGKEEKNQFFNLRFEDWKKLKEVIEDELSEETQWPISKQDKPEAEVLSSLSNLLESDPDFLNKILSNPNVNKLTSASFEALDKLGLRVYEIKAKNVEFLLNKLANARDDELKNFVSILNELKIGQISSIAELVNKKVSIINLLESLVSKKETKERQVHELLERNLWLLDNNYDLLRSNKTLSKFLKCNIKDDPDLKKRPDLILKTFLQDENHIVLVELKRPSVPIKSEHIGQVFEYKGIIQNHNPAIKIIDLYLIGYDISNNVPKDLVEPHIDIWENIIARKKHEFDEFLQVLEESDETDYFIGEDKSS